MAVPLRGRVLVVVLSWCLVCLRCSCWLFLLLLRLVVVVGIVGAGVGASVGVGIVVFLLGTCSPLLIPRLNVTILQHLAAVD